ncbi:hypothetical protein Tco_1244489 [Tanacetum coccineum]
MKRVSRGYSGIDFSLFLTMINAPETSPSRITSSPSLSPQHTPVSTPSTSQPPNTQPTPDAEEAVPMPHESPLHSVHSLGRDEGSLSLSELTVLCTNLSNKVTSLEAELAQTKQTYGTALTKLIKKVKKLEQTVKSTQARRRFRIVVSDDEEGLEDPSKQGRKITKIDQDPSISLVQDEGTSWIQEDIEIQEKISDDTEVVLEEEEPTKVVEDQGSGENGEKEVSIVGAKHSTVILEVSPVAANLLEQERLGREEAIRLQEQIDEEERPRIARDAEIAKYDHAVIRYHALQNRAFSVPEVRKNMCMYLINQGGYKMRHFKGMSYEDIRPIFEKVWDQNPKLKRAEPVKRQSTEEEKKRDDSNKPSEGTDVAIDIESLATKYPIVDWKTYDVLDLHRLVKARYMTSSPEGYDLMLWGDLKTLFEPDEEDEGIDFSLFLTMINAPETSPSRITSSPSLSPQHTPVRTPSTSPPNTQPTPDAEEVVPMPHESPLHSVHSLGRDEGNLSLNELTDLCTSLSKKVEAKANLVYIRRSAQKRKDKGKAIMQESEPPKKVKKRVQMKMSMDEELAKKVFEEEQAKAMAEQEQ